MNLSDKFYTDFGFYFSIGYFILASMNAANFFVASCSISWDRRLCHSLQGSEQCWTMNRKYKSATQVKFNRGINARYKKLFQFQSFRYTKLRQAFSKWVRHTAVSQCNFTPILLNYYLLLKTYGSEFFLKTNFFVLLT